MAKTSKPVVLVADDEPSTRALVAGHLRAKGYKIIEAGDGDEAWELAHEHLPHAVVLDVMMPGMSGWEVCRKIREAVSLAHTGVVMLTGIGENLNELTSPLYGADAYVDKPFEFGELDQKLAETLARRSGGAVGRLDGADQQSTTARDGARRQPQPAAAAKREPPKRTQPAAPTKPKAAAKVPAARAKPKAAAKKPAARAKPKAAAKVPAARAKPSARSRLKAAASKLAKAAKSVVKRSKRARPAARPGAASPKRATAKTARATRASKPRATRRR
jgi:CheY-like chemotaxis protein